MKVGFFPLKNAEEKTILYAKYYLVPGLWIDAQQKSKPCWGIFTPNKEMIASAYKFLDAKEKVKTHKIAKYTHQKR